MAFELLIPEDEERLFSLMEENDYKLLAGGMDLFVKMEKGLLNPKFVLTSRDGERRTTLQDFITGPGKTELSRGEYLKEIEIPRISSDFTHYLEKVGRRNALDISVCAMGYLLKEKEGIVEELRLAYGAVAPTVIRATSVEEYLQDKKLNQETIAEAKKLLKSEVSPISDIRGSAEYREKIATRLLDRIGKEPGPANEI